METTQTPQTATLAELADERTMEVVNYYGGTWIEDPEYGGKVFGWSEKLNATSKDTMRVVLYLHSTQDAFNDFEIDDAWWPEALRTARLAQHGPCFAQPNVEVYGKTITEQCTQHEGHSGAHTSVAADGTLTGWTHKQRALKFTTAQYVRNHGKQPSGRGSWAFQRCTAETAFDSQLLGEPTFFYGTLAEAKNALRKTGALGLYAVCS